MSISVYNDGERVLVYKYVDTCEAVRMIMNETNEYHLLNPF